MLLFEHLHGDKPRLIEPRTASTGLALAVLVAIDGVEEISATTVLRSLLIASPSLRRTSRGGLTRTSGS